MKTSPRAWFGRPLKRVEDPKFLTGSENYAGDLTMPGMLYMGVLRSPYAHARIKSIDVSGVLGCPQVKAALTGEDAAKMSERLNNQGDRGSKAHQLTTNFCLSTGKVRYVGEPVAALATTDRYATDDALELIDVDYEPLPPVTDAERALDAGSPLLFEERGNNLCYSRIFQFGDVDEAFAKADVIVKERFKCGRTLPNPMETFSCVVSFERAAGELTVWSGFQGSHFNGPAMLSKTLGLPANKIRFIPISTGGSFGSKVSLYKYLVVASLLSISTGRPIKYFEDRMEHMRASSSCGPDRVYYAEMAGSRDGRILGLKILNIDDIGAYSEFLVQPLKPLSVLTGPYKIENVLYDLRMVFTNKNPQGAYRGAGPPDHVFMLEKLLTDLGRKLDMGQVQLRMCNFISPEEFPYTTPSGSVYDSGNLPELMKRAVRLIGSGEDGSSRQNSSNKLLGTGFSSVIEPTVPGMGWLNLINPGQYSSTLPESAGLHIDPSGKVTVILGFGLQGQGNQTCAVQVASHLLGTEPKDIRVVMADSSSGIASLGPGGSRLNSMISGAIVGAANLILEKARGAAAHLMGAKPEDIDFEGGHFTLKGVPGRSVSLTELAKRLMANPQEFPEELDPVLKATYTYVNPRATLPDEMGRMSSYLAYSSSCHACLVEVDPESGQVNLRKYVFVHDCGREINPMIVEGQVQGAFAMGLGKALYEGMLYDQDGQLLNPTLMDYTMPTAMEIPDAVKDYIETPSPFTPLGTKGVGEALHGVMPALAAAIEDALATYGVRIVETPITSEGIWRKIRSARGVA